jgi:hypothetical protein
MVQQQDGRPTARGFRHALKTIGWAFFGVRGKRGHDQDLSRLQPVHVIVVGLLAALVFVLVLVVIANLAVG